MFKSFEQGHWLLDSFNGALFSNKVSGKYTWQVYIRKET